jgi:hypothetical protein
MAIKLKLTILALLLIGPLSYAQKKRVETLAIQKPKVAVTSRSYWLGSISYNWWQEQIDLKNPSGQTYPLTASTHGPCIGLGYLYRVVNWDILVNGCFFMGQSDISGVQSTPRYSQRSVETMGVFLGPGVNYRPFRQVSIGLAINGFARSAAWTDPPGGWSAEPKTIISGAAMLDTQWRLGHVVLHQKMGPIFNVGTLWSLGLDYIF